MMQKFSYHTHTNYSDGKSTAEEMIKKAKEIGLEELGISDHLTVHKNMLNLPDYDFSAYKKGNKEPFMYATFAEIKEKTLKHFDNIDVLSKKHNIKVLKGFEVDYFTYSGWEEELKEFVKETNADYLINGNHFFFDEACEKLLDIYYVKHKMALSQEESKEYLVRHYKTIEKAIESKLFCFVAHLDYSRAVGASIDMFKDEKISVVKTLAKHGVATEFSTKGIRRQGDAYPTGWLLNELISHKVPLIISDDAHSTEELGALFDEAEDILLKSGNTERYKI